MSTITEELVAATGDLSSAERRGLIRLFTSMRDEKESDDPRIARFANALAGIIAEVIVDERRALADLEASLSWPDPDNPT